MLGRTGGTPVEGDRPFTGAEGTPRGRGWWVTSPGAAPSPLPCSPQARPRVSPGRGPPGQDGRWEPVAWASRGRPASAACAPAPPRLRRRFYGRAVSPEASARTPTAAPARGPWEPQGCNLHLQRPPGPRRRDLSSWKGDPPSSCQGRPVGGKGSVVCRWQPWGAVWFLAPPPPQSSPGERPGSNQHARLEELGGGRPQSCPQVTALHCPLTPAWQAPGGRGTGVTGRCFQASPDSCCPHPPVPHHRCLGSFFQRRPEGPVMVGSLQPPLHARTQHKHWLYPQT